MFFAIVEVEVRDSPNGIFGSWARWTRAPPDVQSCWDAVAAVAAVVAAEPAVTAAVAAAATGAAAAAAQLRRP